MSSWRRTALGEFILAIPPMVRAIMIACVAIWLVELATFKSYPQFVSDFGLSVSALFAGRVWTLVTYQFLHDPVGIGHVLFNMFALWMFGRELERRWGAWPFLVFYLTCGIGGGLVFAAVSAFTGGGFAVGASAAVLGVTAAYGMIWPYRQILMFFIIPMQVRHAVLVIAALELLFAWSSANGLANFAHLGGMATAWIYLRWLTGLGRIPAAIGGKLAGLRGAWRRRKFRNVDKEWERMLREDDDKRAH